MRILLLLLMMVVVAGVAPAQTVVKCTQADGSVAYQQTACTGGAQEKVDVYAPPPPTPVRRMVQAFDPATGVPTEAWMDGTTEPSGATYTTREMRQVFDPNTGIPREAWVDVTRPVPGATRRALPRQKPPSRYDQNSAQDTYLKAKCRVANC